MSSRRTSHACLVALALVLGAAGCDSNTSEPRAAAEQAAPPAPAAPVPPPAPAPDERTATAAAAPASQWETRAPNLTDADIPPLPTAPFPLARPAEVVRAVYVFAAKHPDVLSHVPCFCGCESRGHKHNDDCFVTERDAKGRPTKWEPHGLGWGICLDVARDAMQMHASGADLASIRSTIEAKYRSSYPTMTPTPPVTRRTK